MDEQQHRAKIRQAVSRVERVSSLPKVYARVSALLSDPRSSALDVGKAISADQALTARLLKLVNSAFYGFPSRIDSVTRALTIVGFRQIRELVLATSVWGMFGGVSAGSALDMGGFWKHSLACGVACRVLAVFREEKNAESFFVAGLLHDIGRLIMLENFTDEYSRVLREARENNLLLYQVEEEVFGFNHADVGQELVSFWKLPEALRNAVGCHHDPRGRHGILNHADVVHVGNILAYAMRAGSGGDYFVPPLRQDAWERIGLRKSALEPVMDKMTEQLEQAENFLIAK